MNKQHKIQAALDAVAMATPGDWLVDDFNDLKDGVGEFPIARDVGGTTGTQEAANRKVIAASRDLAEEVLRLRELVREAYKEGRNDGAYVESVSDAHERILAGGNRAPSWETSATKKGLFP